MAALLTMPIQNPIVKPSALLPYKNGEIPRELLEQVDERTGYIWLMASLPARGMRALHAAILKEFGIRMTSTGRGRDFFQQLNPFVQRHVQVTYAEWLKIPPNPDVAEKRIWPEAKAYGYWSEYWKLRPGQASCAPPGTSPHGWWCADDLALPDGPDPDLLPDGVTSRRDLIQWLYANVRSFGFAYSLKSEEWHIQWIMGDIMPPRVLAYEASLAQKPPTKPEVPAEQEEDMKLGVMTVDSSPPATFLGLCEPTADPKVAKFWKVFWIDGNDPQAVAMLTLQQNAGAETYHYGCHVLAGFVLENTKLPTAVHSVTGKPITADDFGAAPWVTA